MFKSSARVFILYYPIISIAKKYLLGMRSQHKWFLLYNKFSDWYNSKLITEVSPASVFNIINNFGL